ncbi:glycosyltransferase [Akkermansiaceae bacterium]|nr:glycosyltransferase [Akkermansiaceae bacterium]
MPPLISIVSPSWNQGAYIAECLSSCLVEEEGLIEHIVIDNCSDDETHQVIESFPHVRAIIEKDRGQSDAINKGIKAARGEWILWLNVDDFMIPGAVEHLIARIRSGIREDAVYGHMVLVDEHSERIRTVFQAWWRPWMIRFGVFATPSTGTLFRASILKENLIGEDFHMIMDTEWSLRTMGKVKALRLRREMVCFRLTEDNKTAAHIKTGHLTPRHAKERKVLGAKYPSYGNYGETGRGRLFHFGVKLVRKCGRFLILTDKVISKVQHDIKNK